MFAQLKKAVKTLKVTKNNSTENADNLIREYKHKRWIQNSERIGKPDSLSAWFSIEEMENFIARAKSHGGDGIKFYYGAYPEVNPDQPQYAGRQTIVPVATKSKLTESGVVANKDIYYIKNNRTQILSGLLPTTCPPLCSPRTEGGMGDLGITIIDRGTNGMEIV